MDFLTFDQILEDCFLMLNVFMLHVIALWYESSSLPLG